jgi:hypothetical protein
MAQMVVKKYLKPGFEKRPTRPAGTMHPLKSLTTTTQLSTARFCLINPETILLTKPKTYPYEL